MSPVRFYLSTLLLLTITGGMMAAALSRLDAHLAVSAVERQEAVTSYRSAGVAE